MDCLCVASVFPGKRKKKPFKKIVLIIKRTDDKLVRDALGKNKNNTHPAVAAQRTSSPAEKKNAPKQHATQQTRQRRKKKEGSGVLT